MTPDLIDATPTQQKREADNRYSQTVREIVGIREEKKMVGQRYYTTVCKICTHSKKNSKIFWCELIDGKFPPIGIPDMNPDAIETVGCGSIERRAC